MTLVGPKLISAPKFTQSRPVQVPWEDYLTVLARHPSHTLVPSSSDLSSVDEKSHTTSPSTIHSVDSCPPPGLPVRYDTA
ncbi:hypothetical protein GWI33_016932 [Rhynchophorus ferrugineus]|uniref:Uncharacterized protein n=1 Tax=Rhynchophorus ferrugineus TaxID=354439 RepID=A0A834M9T3_RHYFE|nr:hypothetical protein GWI33_016932 [Rhynchophorus ferrugineus]